ncbi:MAG: hypothetical protein GY769_20930 [bacterium]|nr:hypothetical protein [bacterium]
MVGTIEANAASGAREAPHITLLGDQRGIGPAEVCGTSHPETPEHSLRQLRADPGLNPGDPIYFDIEPATIPLGRKVPIRVRNLMILGDYPQIEFSLLPDGPERLFDRLETRTIDGDLVSVYDVTFPRGDLYAGRRAIPIRFDHIGRVAPETTRYLRLRSSTIPRTPVVRINDRVQYSSHVVNIVVPHDGLSVFSLPGEEIAAEFYRHFTDTYEELAFVPERFYWSPRFGARHQFVYQDIEGIGLATMNDRPRYANSSVLHDWIFYIRGDLQSNFLSVHETGHNWGWFMSLFDAAGVQIEGSTECAGLEYDGTSVHAPLAGDEHTFLSQCIYSPLYVAKRNDVLTLAEAPTPLSLHPLTLYAMGFLEADDVPRMYLGAKQGAPRSTAPGTRLDEDWTEVTIEDIQRVYGERRGPVVPAVWRRAMIVVSPERLLSKTDLRWFNFYAKRISDPDVTGVESLAGIPSLEIATLGMMDVQTEIRPRSHPRVDGDFTVSYPELGKRDILGLKLKRPLGSRYEVGRSYVLKGKVKKPGPHETISVVIGTKIFTAEIGAKKKFSVKIELEPRDRGRHWMTIGLGNLDTVLGRIAPIYVE